MSKAISISDDVVSFTSNMMGAMCGAGTDVLPQILSSPPGFLWSCCCSMFSIVFVDHCSSYKCIVCLLAAIINVLSVFWFTASDFLFGIIKLLLADKPRNTSCKNYRRTQMTTTSYTASDRCSKHGIAPLQPTGDLNTELYRCSRQVI